MLTMKQLESSQDAEYLVKPNTTRRSTRTHTKQANRRPCPRAVVAPLASASFTSRNNSSDSQQRKLKTRQLLHLVSNHNTRITPVSSPQPNKPAKHVRFGQVYECTYRQRPPSKSERKVLWYSAKEIRAIRREICMLNLSALTEYASNDANACSAIRQPFDDGLESWRGLEHVRQGALLVKLEHRQDFVKAFLYFCKELGVCDPAALAVFSATNSQADRRRAVELAKRDAFDACHIYHHFLTAKPRSKEAKAAQLYVEQPRAHTMKGNHKVGRRERRPANTRHDEKRRPLQAQMYNLTLSL